MSSETGQFNANKTWRFLLPCLRGHGETFVKKFNPVLKEVGIYDNSLVDRIDGRNIFVLCDMEYETQAFSEFLNWIRYQDYYITDYTYGLTNTKTMIVIAVPSQFNHAYDMFLKGKFSKMYSPDEVKALFSIPSREREYGILTLDKKYVDEFVKQINKEFATENTAKDFGDFEELELPLKICEETFNCLGTEGKIFFTEELDKIWN